PAPQVADRSAGRPAAGGRDGRPPSPKNRRGGLMKRIGWVTSLVLIAALAGCSSITTNSDYNPATAFSKYTTVGWHETNSVRAPIWHDRSKSAGIAGLQSRGLTLDESHPDLWVAAHTRLSEETQINTYNTGWGYGWGWRGGMGMQSSTVQKIPVG